MKPLTLACLMGVALLFQCQHGARPGATSTTPTRTHQESLQKAACHDVCWRTFQDCMAHVLLATGKVSRGQLEKFVRTGLMNAAKMTGYAGCMHRCRQGMAQTRTTMPPTVKRCLKLRSCEAYASCMIPRRSSAR